MPPKSSFTGSFAATDANNEVVCPLRNQDGSNCRKRCLGEKRYRSMQEHIRRAHPQHYIPKLPATEESFQLMITTPPSERPPQPAPAPASGSPAVHGRGYSHSRDAYKYDTSSGKPRKKKGSNYPAATDAAFALAQLHTHGNDSDWDSDLEYGSDNEGRLMKPSIELPSIQDHIRDHQFHSFHPSHPRELLPSVMTRSPERSSTLPPIHRRDSMSKRDRMNRPHKGSISHNSRKPKHERKRSREYGRRLSFEGRRQAYSAEPPIMTAAAAAAQGRRWEELIEAASAATEADSDRDLTPIPASPQSSALKRASMPPFMGGVSSQSQQSYKASPLARTLTPPPNHALSGPAPFPSIETAGMSHESINRSPSNSHSTHTSSASGQNFHMPPTGLSSDPANQQSSPPTYYSGVHPQHASDILVSNGGSLNPSRNSYPQSSTFGAHSHLLNNTSSPSQPVGGAGGASTSQGPASSTTSLSIAPRRASSPISSTLVSIYCANCRRPSLFKDSYACTECISGFCSDCVYMLTSPGATTQNLTLDGASASTQAAGDANTAGSQVSGASADSANNNSLSRSSSSRLCPRCGIRGGRYKSFQVEIVKESARGFKDERDKETLRRYESNSSVAT